MIFPSDRSRHPIQHLKGCLLTSDFCAYDKKKNSDDDNYGCNDDYDDNDGNFDDNDD